MIVGLHHVHLVCSDLPAAESWFVDGLGAELVERRESRGLPTSELRLAGLRDLHGRTVAPHRSAFVPCDLTLRDLCDMPN